MTSPQPWTSQYRPKTRVELLGNEQSLEELTKWLRKWEKKPPKNKGIFIVGPPGVGKTSAVQVVAEEMGYDLIEINASDYRTKKRLEEIIGRSSSQTVTIQGEKRMILFDEMEGVSGVQDRGGISTIVEIIKNSRIPIILIATTMEENMEDKFRPLRRITKVIEFSSVPSRLVYNKLSKILKDQGIDAEQEALENLTMMSQGDLRSVINDLESICRGKKSLSVGDIDLIAQRDKQIYTPDLLNNLFSAKTLKQARGVISSSYINYDELYDWIYENLPNILDDPEDLYNGLESLANADLYEKRSMTTSYRLLKYMLNEMTGGVAFSRKRSKGLGLKKQALNAIRIVGEDPNRFGFKETKNGMLIKPLRWLGRDRWRDVNESLRDIGARWIYGENHWELPYYKSPQLKWRYIKTLHSRRNLNSIAGKLAEKCHISKQEAITQVMPMVKLIFQSNDDMAEDISEWLNLDTKENDFLTG